MKLTELISDYLGFTRKERIGVFVILLIISLAIFFPLFFSGRGSSLISNSPDTAWIAAVRELEQQNVRGEKDVNEREPNIQSYQYDFKKDSYYKPGSKGQLFYFDPNTLETEGWQKLGLRSKTIQTIQNYLSKGGEFKKPEDLRKIYGLHNDIYEQIAPYIRIEKKIQVTGSNNFDEKKLSPAAGIYQRELRVYQNVDVNLSDTSAFIQLPGIGSKLASRIISFREKLGGFYKIEQVSETFGLHDSIFQKIRPYLLLESVSIKQINLNTATIEELRTHPYIKFNLANSIVLYRNEHGTFEKVEDLKKIMIIDDKVFERISPYLIVK